MKRAVAALVLAAVLVMGVAVPAYAAGSVITTSAEVGSGTTKYTIVWTSSAGGVVSANTSAVRVGTLIKVELVPSATVAPTDAYDLTLLDSNNVDLLNSVAGDASATASEIFIFDPPIWLDDTALTVAVTNAGAAKSGTVILWVR